MMNSKKKNKSVLLLCGLLSITIATDRRIESDKTPAAAVASSKIDAKESWSRFLSLSKEKLDIDLNSLTCPHTNGALEAVLFVSGLLSEIKLRVSSQLFASSMQKAIDLGSFEAIFQDFLQESLPIAIQSLENIDPESNLGVIKRYIAKVYFECYGKQPQLSLEEVISGAFDEESSKLFATLRSLTTFLPSYKPFKIMESVEEGKLQDIADSVRPYLVSEAAFKSQLSVIYNLKCNSLYLVAPGAIRTQAQFFDILQKFTSILPDLLPDGLVNQIVLTKLSGNRTKFDFTDKKILAKLLENRSLAIIDGEIKCPSDMLLTPVQKKDLLGIIEHQSESVDDLMFNSLQDGVLNLQEVKSVYRCSVRKGDGYNELVVSFDYPRGLTNTRGTFSIIPNTQDVRVSYYVQLQSSQWIGMTDTPCTINDLVWWNKYQIIALDLPGLVATGTTRYLLRESVILSQELISKLAELYSWLDTRGAEFSYDDIIREVRSRGFEI